MPLSADALKSYCMSSESAIPILVVGGAGHVGACVQGAGRAWVRARRHAHPDGLLSARFGCSAKRPFRSLEALGAPLGTGRQKRSSINARARSRRTSHIHASGGVSLIQMKVQDFVAWTIGQSTIPLYS